MTVNELINFLSKMPNKDHEVFILTEDEEFKEIRPGSFRTVSYLDSPTFENCYAIEVE